MKDSKQLLTAVLHTTQMGQTGIRSVQQKAVRPGLKQELKEELAQYDAMEKETLALAKQRGWHLANLNPGIRKMADMMSRARLASGEVDSKIAGILIQGNTRGMILGTKNLHRADSSDCQVVQLTQKLLDRQCVNIENARRFL